MLEILLLLLATGPHPNSAMSIPAPPPAIEIVIENNRHGRRKAAKLGG
jgi:hypothetical protein